MVIRVSALLFWDLEQRCTYKWSFELSEIVSIIVFRSGPVMQTSLVIWVSVLLFSDSDQWYRHYWLFECLYYCFQIRTSGADVIGFQEVRADARGARNQVEELRQLVARYRWSHFQPSGNVTLVKGSYIKEWEIEGKSRAVLWWTCGKD